MGWPLAAGAVHVRFRVAFHTVTVGFAGLAGLSSGAALVDGDQSLVPSLFWAFTCTW